MFYTALVVNNVDADLTGKVEVYVPAIMVKQKRNVAEPNEHTIDTPFKIIGGDVTESMIKNKKITETNTISAFPVALTGYDHGQYLVPENGDEILIFFKDDNKQIAYYMYASTYKKGRLLEYGKIIEDEENSTKADKRVDQKVLLLTKSGHVICFNDTIEKNGVIIKAANQHKVRLDTTKERSSASIETAKGHTLILDDTNKGIAMKTTNGHSVLLDDKNSGINITTVGGMRLTLDDKNNIVQIVTPKGIGLEFDDNETKLRIDSKDIEVTASNDISTEAKNNISSTSLKDTTFEAKNNFSITSTNNTDIEAKNNFSTKSSSNTTMESNSNFSIEAKNNFSTKSSSNTTMESNSNFSIEGKAGVKVEGATIENSAKGSYKVEGASVDINGKATINIEANGSVTIKGPIITLDGTLINMGQGASQPIIKGLEFLALFNAHTHVSPIGPTTPPVTPMLPTMLSTTTLTK